MTTPRTVLVTGGAGYVGSALVPRLLERGYRVRVLDLYLFGENPFPAIDGPGQLEHVKGDIRDRPLLEAAVGGCDAVIHLACISNDPSFELHPQLARTINRDAFPQLLEACRRSRVRRFIYASSSSVYGVREEPQVTETSPCTPLTDYSRFKLECEQVLWAAPLADMVRVVIRPATVCGWAPRMRLDLTVNILTISALERGEIFVDGGDQLRPNLHIGDMVRVYELLLDAPAALVDGEVYNVGYRNASVRELAEIIRARLADRKVTITIRPTVDHRSYRINADKIRERLGYAPRYTIEDAVDSIVRAYADGRLPDPLTNPGYYNVRVLKDKMPTLLASSAST